MVLHSLNIDIRSASFELEQALAELYESNDLRDALPGHAATLTFRIERSGSEHALGLVPIDERTGAFAENNLCGCPCFYAGGRFYARGEDGDLEIEYCLDRHEVRANVGGGLARDPWAIAIRVVRGLLQSFVLPFYGLKTLHGAVVSGGGRTIMLTGPGQAGKTTTALWLQRHGYELLSDDAPFFFLGSGRACVASSLDYYHVSPGTLTVLPWLGEHVIAGTGIRGKLAISPSRLHNGDGWRQPRELTHIVELQRAPVDAPRLTTRDRTSATAALLRDEMVVFRRARDDRFARHSALVFELLTTLMRDARALRLEFADDQLEALPELLDDPLMEAA